VTGLLPTQLERVLAGVARALGDVAVACAPVGGPSGAAGPLAEAAPEALVGQERGLYLRYRTPGRRAQFLAGRIAARRALALALGRPPAAAPEIGRDSAGAPVVNDHPGLQVSISHSHGLAVAVAAPFAVGVDLELDEPRPEALARHFFSAAERAALAAAPAAARQALVTELWTRKEAAAKVGRWGGRLPFAALDCTGEALTVSGRRIGLRSARAGGYALCVARELGGG
jgi:4'-phosphopantetheinyl transferase